MPTAIPPTAILETMDEKVPLSGFRMREDMNLENDIVKTVTLFYGRFLQNRLIHYSVFVIF